jgi:hypothetical protein
MAYPWSLRLLDFQGSKHDKVYQKINPLKFLFQKQFYFNIHIQKDIKNLFKLHFEIIKLFIEFLVSWT